MKLLQFSWRLFYLPTAIASVSGTTGVMSHVVCLSVKSGQNVNPPQDDRVLDHATITLHGWHRVLMNTEGQSKAVRNVAFLD